MIKKTTAESKTKKGKKIEIVSPKQTGFCNGVKNAVMVAKKNAKGAYSLGQIVHNKFVTDTLNEIGLSVVSNIEKIDKGKKVIFRSHGEHKKNYEIAKENKLKVIDTVCPFVLSIRNLIIKYSEDGFIPIIAGDKSHPEVKGLLSFSSCRGYVVSNKNAFIKLFSKLEREHKKITNNKLKILLISQTTFNNEIFNEIADSANCLDASKGKAEFLIRNTICGETKNRQKEVIKLSKLLPVIIVIGDKDSSNSKKLFSISKTINKMTFFITSRDELKKLKREFDLRVYNKIGIIAGASVPSEIIKNIKEELIDV